MPSRRDFLKGIATAGAVPGIEPGPAHAVAPDQYSRAEADRYFVRHPASDFMVDVIRGLGLESVATNPGSSFRGLQESIANHGGNRTPELLTCPHEESAVGIGHGYAKIAYRPDGRGLPRHGRPPACGDGHLQRVV